jgi:hypothetical protein
MLRTLSEHDLLSAAITEETQTVLTHELLFPLYPFDLSLNRNFKELPPLIYLRHTCPSVLLFPFSLGGPRFVCDEVSAGECWRGPGGWCGCSCS